MNFDMFRGKSLCEQEYILKYFYLIDPKSLSDSVQKKLNIKDGFDLNSPEGTELFFHTIFDQLYAYAYQYLKFIPTNGFKDSFFGEPIRTPDGSVHKDLTAFAFLLRLSLYNYCITEGFFYYLEKEYCTNLNNDFSKLRSANEAFLKTGFFARPYKYSDKDSPIAADDPRPQRWNALYKSFRKQEKNSLLFTIAHDFFKYETNSEKFFSIPNIYKFPLSTYFTCHNLYSFSKNSVSSSCGTLRSTGKLYNSLHQALITHSGKHTALTKTDIFIYQTMNERYFGFSTVSYISKILNKLYESGKNTYEFLNKYKGNAFESLLTSLSNCPLVYHRHLFFEYALKALKGNDKFETHYLKDPSSFSQSAPLKPLTDVEQTSKGLILIEQYFHVLNSMVLPMISALFKTTLSHLEPLVLANPNSSTMPDCSVSSNPCKLTTYFKMYIDNHFSLLTTDFIDLNYASGEKFGNTKFWSSFVSDIEQQCHQKQMKKSSDNIYYDSFSDVSGKTYMNSALRKFFAPLKEESKKQQRYLPFSYIPEEEKVRGGDVSVNEISTFQYENAKKLLGLFL